MVISRAELKVRKNFIGSSDVAMMFGMSKYGGIGDLYPVSYTHLTLPTILLV